MNGAAALGKVVTSHGKGGVIDAARLCSRDRAARRRQAARGL